MVFFQLDQSDSLLKHAVTLSFRMSSLSSFALPKDHRFEIFFHFIIKFLLLFSLDISRVKPSIFSHWHLAISVCLSKKPELLPVQQQLEKGESHEPTRLL